jgi:hypothetical protein
MIISLVAVCGLQGMENKLAITKDETELKKAFKYCIESHSSISKNEQSSFKRRLAVCPLTGTPDAIYKLTKKVIVNECNNVGINWSGNGYGYDCYNTDSIKTCVVYNTGENLAQDLENIKKLIENKQISFLFTTTNVNDTARVYKALGEDDKKDMKLFSLQYEEFKRWRQTLAAAEDEVAQSYGRQLGLIITFKNFVTNRWVITGSLLAAFLAYCYKFAR